jgi:hypothetical protein
MARTQSLDVPDELKNLYNASLEKRDRFELGVLQGHKREPSKAQKKLLRRAAIINSPQEGRGSLFRFLSPLWRTLTPTQKAVWSAAGAVMGLNNWQVFISDNAARIRNSLTLVVPPSALWQVNTGYLTIQSPASEIILKQEHPLDYWVAQKVVGQSWKKELVLLHESITLPIDLEIRYKANLSAVGGTQRARYFARVWTSYQGEDVYTDFVINFTPSTDWTLASVETSGLYGIIIGYTLFVEIVGYTGELFFDNIRAVHGGTNWARDPRCNEIDKTFQKAFSVVPPFWIAESLPAGAAFSSEFPPAL